MSSNNELKQILAAHPAAAHSDFMRYGVEALELTASRCVGLLPIVQQESTEVVPVDGCEFIELEAEIVFCDFPVLRDWAEVVTRCPVQFKKEARHG